jgi:uncharacterized RDD family membrane protein YckC
MMIHPPFYRRLGAMVYDTLLVFAILIIGTALLLLFTKGQAISAGNYYYQTYLLFLWLSFMVWFWTHGGQTAGMAAWRIRLVTQSGQPVSTKQALVRLLICFPSLAAGGLGLWWALWDRNKMTFYDRFSRTQLILIP